MKHFKLKLALVSLTIFFLCLFSYYFLYVYLQKSNSKFCDHNYCFELLSLGDFLAILIAIIGIGVVVITLESWKDGQRYLEKRELLFNTRESLRNVKDELLTEYHQNYINPNHLVFLSLIARSSNIEENLTKIKIDHNLIETLKRDRKEAFNMLGEKLINNINLDNQTITSKCAILMVSMQKCIESLDQKIEDEAL